MAKIKEVQLTKRQIELLESIGDDAAQKAAQSTAFLLNTQFEISAVHAEGMQASEVANIVDDPESIVAAIYLKVDGCAPGHAAFICPERAALDLVDCMTGFPPGSTLYLDEIGQSALQELGNILTSSYLTSLSEHTGLTFLPSPPQLVMDMAYALVSTILAGTTEGSAEAISIVTNFSHSSGPLQGYFVFIPEQTAVSVLLDSLKEAA